MAASAFLVGIHALCCVRCQRTRGDAKAPGRGCVDGRCAAPRISAPHFCVTHFCEALSLDGRVRAPSKNRHSFHSFQGMMAPNTCPHSGQDLLSRGMGQLGVTNLKAEVGEPGGSGSGPLRIRNGAVTRTMPGPSDGDTGRPSPARSATDWQSPARSATGRPSPARSSSRLGWPGPAWCLWRQSLAMGDSNVREGGWRPSRHPLHPHPPGNLYNIYAYLGTPGTSPELAGCSRPWGALRASQAGLRAPGTATGGSDPIRVTRNGRVASDVRGRKRPKGTTIAPACGADGTTIAPECGRLGWICALAMQNLAFQIWP
jgi:hypothetical protein